MDETKSGIYHRPNVDLNDLMIPSRREDDCAFCFHVRLRHKNKTGICNQCAFFCERHRHYPPKHTPDPNFHYWYENLK
jgi:hypothetical protein